MGKSYLERNDSQDSFENDDKDDNIRIDHSKTKRLD